MNTTLADATTDWTSAITGIVSAAVALAGMIGSLVGWLLAKKNAGKAEAALQEVAAAQGKIAAAQSEIAIAQTSIAEHSGATRTDAEKAQARQVVVQTANFMGGLGAAVRNTSDRPVFDLFVGLIGQGELGIRSTRGVDLAVTERPFIDVLGSQVTTGERSVFVRLKADGDMSDFLSKFQIRFRDAQDVWWERMGNQEPVKIPAPKW